MIPKLNDNHKIGIEIEVSGIVLMWVLNLTLQSCAKGENENNINFEWKAMRFFVCSAVIHLIKYNESW